MTHARKKKTRFSASKRDFLKKMLLAGIYIGPAIKSFEAAQLASKPTGPPKKKKKDTTGTTQTDHIREGGDVA